MHSTLNPTYSDTALVNLAHRVVVQSKAVCRLRASCYKRIALIKKWCTVEQREFRVDRLSVQLPLVSKHQELQSR